MYRIILLSSLHYFSLFPSGFTIPTNERQRSPSPSEIDWNSLGTFSTSPVRIDDLLSPLSHSDMIKHEGLATASENHSQTPTGISSTKPSSSSIVNALKPRKVYNAKEKRKIRYQNDKQICNPFHLKKRKKYWRIEKKGNRNTEQD